MTMMTLKEIEAACDASQSLDFSKHGSELSDLPLKKMFYPLGFSVEMRTNSSEVMGLYEERWGMFEKRHGNKPIGTDVHVVEGDDSTECPPTPVFRIMLPLMVAITNAHNYSIIDFERNSTSISIARKALQHKAYLKYALLGTPGCCIATRYATPVHGGCVSLDGRGVLLCGDSGAGKSTLSYACARAGWTFTSDDGCYVSNEGNDLTISGEYRTVRLRPAAEEFFPEMKGMELSRRAEGKASIELPITPTSPILCAQTAQVDFVVFLNRHSGLPPALVPFRKDVARHAMMQTLYGLPETLAVQHATIERLLSVDVLELRYSDLDWAIERLQKLVRERR
jgi:hypothetical protein